MTPEEPEPERDAPGPLELEQPSGPGRYRKVRTRAPGLPDDETDRPVTAVIEVSEAGYRPSDVDVRGAITDTLITVTVRPSALPGLEADPRVVSIELGSPVDRID